MATGNVLVVGDNDLAGLAAVRSLGRAGLHVHLAAFEASPITRSSRYVRQVHRLGHPLAEPDRFMTRFMELIERQPFDLILPTSDKALVPLMAGRERLERHGRLAAPDARAFRIAHRKEETLALAEQLGIATPRTQLIGSRGDLADISFPLVLKPSASVQASQVERNEVRIVRSMAELAASLPRMLKRGPVLAQEFCPGHGVGLSVLAREGEIVAAFQHERVHEPPQGGASSYRRSLPLDPALLADARRMFAALRWTGPAMMEFKVDSASGRAVLMEINGRLWGSLALAIQAGVDFPKLMYDLFVHERTRPVFTYRVPFAVRHTVRDVYWLRENCQAPAGRSDLLRKSAAEIAAELGSVIRGQEGYDLETLDDPLPAVLAWMQLGQELAAGAGRRLEQLRDCWLADRQARRVRRGDPLVAGQLRQARSVLFVCMGNINRSAVAAEALRRSAPHLRVGSAGLLPRAGLPTGSTSLQAARELGLDLSAHRSTPLTARLLQEHDLIIVMEPAHWQGVRKLHAAALARTYPLAAFCASGSRAIADPDGGDAELFKRIYQRVMEGTAGLQRLLTPAQSLQRVA